MQRFTFGAGIVAGTRGYDGGSGLFAGPAAGKAEFVCLRLLFHGHLHRDDPHRRSSLLRVTLVS